MGTLEDGPPPYWNGAYWVSVLYSDLSNSSCGIIKIPTTASEQMIYYPLKTDLGAGYTLQPQHCGKYLVTRFGDMFSAGFCLWEIAEKQLKPFFSQDGFCSTCFEIGNNQFIGLKNDHKTLEVWDLSTMQKSWSLDGDWYKAQCGISFHDYLPDLNVVFGDDGTMSMLSI